jgi:transcription termination factor Rho
MPAKFLSCGSNLRRLEIKARARLILQINQKHMHSHKQTCSCKLLKIADSCFTDGGILWKRITWHGKQKTVIVTPKSIRSKIISDLHGDVITGHVSKKKTKERIISSYWWPGMDI